MDWIEKRWTIFGEVHVLQRLRCFSLHNFSFERRVLEKVGEAYGSGAVSAIIVVVIVVVVRLCRHCGT